MSELIIMLAGSAIGISLSHLLIFVLERRDDKNSKSTYEWLLEEKRKENANLSKLWITLDEIRRLEESNERFKKWINEIEKEQEEDSNQLSIDNDYIKDVVKHGGRVERTLRSEHGEVIRVFDKDERIINTWFRHH